MNRIARNRMKNWEAIVCGVELRGHWNQLQIAAQGKTGSASPPAKALATKPKENLGANQSTQSRIRIGNRIVTMLCLMQRTLAL